MSELLEQLKRVKPNEQNSLRSLALTDQLTIRVYPNSVNFKDNVCFFIATRNGGKYLWIVSNGNGLQADIYQGEPISQDLLCCPLNNHNANLIRQQFDFCRPKLIGLDDSFGFGDRLGIANPAHIRSLVGSAMKPILAQQSIRELQRTDRTPNEVMDAATWAVLQEGYKDGFGADADHLKTTADIDLMARAGYTFFTIDPSEHVVNEADSLSMEEVEQQLNSFTWQLMGERVENFVDRYAGQSIVIADDFILQPTREDVLRGLLKYGGVIAYTVKMYQYLKDTYGDRPSEAELSVDETESATSPFEHFLVANELKRYDVKLVSLAPRFVGDFEKGVDYKGDIEHFKSEYLKHAKIAEKLGPYKISFHSGSDKFTIYKRIGSLNSGRVHIKTAGTSYLEAVKTIALEGAELFREILRFSMDNFEVEKRTYHVSADVGNVPDIGELADDVLAQLFSQDDVRQILHVNFGKVLTIKDENGDYQFRDRILQCLEDNEETHYQNLIGHFKRHLQPFDSWRRD